MFENLTKYQLRDQKRSDEINIEKRAKGVYHVVLSNTTKTYSGKIVFE